MDKKLNNAVARVVASLVEFQAKRATKILSEKLVISAQRRSFKGKIDKRDNIEIVLKIGRPNYEERKFIKQCKQAKEPFPIRGVILKFFRDK